MCHGDISLVYWWNDTYSWTDEQGTKHYTEEYLSRNISQRAIGSHPHWDTDVQCRDFGPISDWMDDHMFDIDNKYGGTKVS
jgi:hypothetical protein